MSRDVEFNSIRMFDVIAVHLRRAIEFQMDSFNVKILLYMLSFVRLLSS